jgi:hypothetical protein
MDISGLLKGKDFNRNHEEMVKALSLIEEK